MLGTNCSNTMYVPFSIFSITGCEYKSGKVRKMNLKRTWKGLNSFELTDISDVSLKKARIKRL